MTKKEQIEEIYIDALNNDEAPNVFADRILFLFGVVWQSEQFNCGKERVYGEERCKLQCDMCNVEYNDN